MFAGEENAQIESVNDGADVYVRPTGHPLAKKTKL